MNSKVFAFAITVISCAENNQLKVEITTTTRMGCSGYFITTRSFRSIPEELTLQVVSAAWRRGTPRPRCLVPRRGRMECPRLRPFDNSAFRHGCCREGGRSGVMPRPLNNNYAAGSLQHPGATATATSGTTTSPETTSGPRAQ